MTIVNKRWLKSKNFNLITRKNGSNCSPGGLMAMEMKFLALMRTNANLRYKSHMNYIVFSKTYLEIPHLQETSYNAQEYVTPKE